MPDTTMTLGAAFAEALAAKDFERIGGLLHPEVDFRAVTPRKAWEAQDAATVVSEVLGAWFDETREVEELVQVEEDAFADRTRVGYRMRVRTPEGLHLVEQQAYIGERDGRIGWMRVACSGFRPVAG
jgi:hypothetical protein